MIWIVICGGMWLALRGNSSRENRQQVINLCLIGSFLLILIRFRTAPPLAVVFSLFVCAVMAGRIIEILREDRCSDISDEELEGGLKDD
jgi:hypothetical protein